MKKVKSFTLHFDIHEDVLQTALGRDDNLEIATDEMKVLLAYQLYLMCYDYERMHAFDKDGCITARIDVREEEEGYA